jgi:calcineurin-like phosphoesterase family protein
MSWTIIENCNQMVTERDTLVLMGDTALGKLEGGGGTLAMLGEIRAGRLVLLPGNHDRWSLAYGHRGDAAARRLTRARWRAVYRSAASSGKWGAKRGADGVLVVPDRTPSMWQAWIGGQMVNLSHYPYRGGGDSRGGGVDRYESLRGEDPGAESGVPLICGHVHTAWRDSVGERGGRMINVGVDQWGFAPVPESALAEMAWAA